MRIPCDCGSEAFHLNIVMPTGLEAECVECGRTEDVGETAQMRREA